MAAYSTIVGEIATHVDGCPTAVIEAYVRKVVVDLCERAKVWRVRMDPLVLTSGDYSYTLTSPVAGTEISSVLQATLTLASPAVTKPLGIGTVEQMFRSHPTWPTDGVTGEPANIVQTGVSALELQPIPDNVTTYTVNALLAIRPTLASTGWDDALFSEFRRTIFHGVIHELTVLPGRKWSNEKTSAYHGKQWEYMLYQARAKANKGFGRTSLSVKMKPWA